jgi:hypothetical protein
MKLACLYELIGLPDCAMEILNHFEQRLAPFGDLEPLRDALTPPLLGEQLTYREYIARFDRDPQLFLPSALPAPPPPEPPAPAAAPAAAVVPPGSKVVAARKLLGRVKRRMLKTLRAAKAPGRRH